MKLESKCSRLAIVDCLKNNLNRIGFSIVWIQAENSDRFYIYIFEGFLNKERADTIQDCLFESGKMPKDCVCLIKLTYGSPYTFVFRSDYRDYDKGRLQIAIKDSFNNNRYLNNEVEQGSEDFGAAKVKIEFKELMTLPRYAE